MENKEFIEQLKLFLETKGLTTEEAKEYLTSVFVKAFEKDKDALSRYEEEEPEPATVEVDLDMEAGTVSIKKYLEVVEEKSIIARFRQIELEDERMEGSDLKVGDHYIQEIDLESITSGRIHHIKQLFLQKLSEVEKMQVYKKFSKYKGELLNAKIHRVLSKGDLILDYEGDSIFMPARQVSILDRDRIIEGLPLTVFVLEIEEIAKDAQIIASRSNPQFVAKLIERENDDVSDGVVVIEGIAREAGFKTKVAVSSRVEEVDPVGSIIGVQGQRIRPIVDEIGGERLDVIKYHEDLKQFIAEALLPAEITGIRLTITEDDWREAVVVVEEDQFLPALGKNGINIKLAAILTRAKLDVKTVQEAKDQGIEYEAISKSKYVAQTNNTFNDGMAFEEYESVEEMADMTSSMEFTAEDYEIDETILGETDTKEQTVDTEEDYGDFDYDEEFEG